MHVLLAAVAAGIVCLAAYLVVRRRGRRRLRFKDRPIAPPAENKLMRLDVFHEEEGDDDDDAPPDSCPAVPISFDPDALEPAATTAEAPMFDIVAVGRTDRGKKRHDNEDALLVRANDGLCIVADGMGGHRGGAIASRLAVDTIAEAVENHTFQDKPHPQLPVCASEVTRAIQMACTRIRDAAKRDPVLQKMGTTVVAARFCGDRSRLYVNHVGDSRCYRYREGALQQMTTDHTMASFGVAGDGAGLLSRAVGPKNHVVTDVVVAKPHISDVYLLCSDGLTKVVPDDLIRDVLELYWDLERAAERLVELANKRGGPDNVTVVLVRVTAHAEPEA
jgi:protein phosphatase